MHATLVKDFQTYLVYHHNQEEIDFIPKEYNLIPNILVN